jgi:hypothetical protein
MSGPEHVLFTCNVPAHQSTRAHGRAVATGFEAGKRDCLLIVYRYPHTQLSPAEPYRAQVHWYTIRKLSGCHDDGTPWDVLNSV